MDAMARMATSRLICWRRRRGAVLLSAACTAYTLMNAFERAWGIP